ncbi:hypothetical protein FRC02_006831 [Tulasnella sp. 418]|nr:hypothetical protein FRC02_006831 [Tulasnella sp. 418]
MRPRTVDDDNEFWSTYVVAAAESDKQTLETWNKTLDSLLTFAALFSGVNTAFIIESYKSLQPDSSDVTNSLLRVLIRHKNDSPPVSEAELGDSDWRSSMSAIRVNSVLFVSLACSLLAAFGAVLGKEMLALYGSTIALAASATPDQGRRRQRKFDGLNHFRFRILMQMLPVLLQLSLVLFLIGLIDFIWSLNIQVAMAFMIPVVVGLVAYLWSLVTALHYKDSPFQTSLSFSIRIFCRTVIESEAMHQIYWRFATKPEPTQTGEQEEITSLFGEISLDADPLVPSKSWLPWSERRRDIMMRLKQSRIMEKGDWLLDGWRSVRPQWRILDMSHDEKSNHKHSPQDIQSSDCVVWLLKNGHHGNVVRKALKAFPLLPADVLLHKQKGTMEPYVSIYTSSLNRRPGDVEFRWDDPRLKEAVGDAVIAGSAIFHVLKARVPETESSIRNLSFQIDPDIYDAIDDEEPPEFHFPLATVIVCVQTQMGVTDWTIKLLSRLIARYLANVRSSKDSENDDQPFESYPGTTFHRPLDVVVSATAPFPSNSSAIGFFPGSQDAISTVELMPPPITLLLDAVIYCASQRYHWDDYFTVLRRFEAEYENIMGMLQAILEEMSDSMSISSHIALATAAIQWYKRREDQSESLEHNGISLSKLRLAWLTVDKRAAFFDNIVLAFSMVSVAGDSPATLKLYGTLVDITEQFLPRAMDSSDRMGDTWKIWWPKMTRIIPGLLRLVRQIDPNDSQVMHTTLRIIARLLPNDWDLQRTQRYISASRIPPDLYALSPMHPDHGPAISVLIASNFSTTHPASPRTRNAAAEALGWMFLYPGVDTSLSDLINNSSKGIMFNQVTGIPSFLMSMWHSTSKITSIPSKQNDFYEKIFSLILGMNAEKGTLAHTVQMEALVIGMANFYQFPYATVTTRENFHKYLPPDFTSRSGKSTILILWDLLNITLRTKDTGFSIWPQSFDTFGITENGIFDDPNLSQEELSRREEGLRARRAQKNLSGLEINTVWAGEAIVLIWQRVKETKMVGSCDFFFHEDAIKAVIDGFGVAFDRRTNSARLEVSFDLVKEYLEKVIQDHPPSEELMVKTKATLIELDAMKLEKRQRTSTLGSPRQRHVSVYESP